MGNAQLKANESGLLMDLSTILYYLKNAFALGIMAVCLYALVWVIGYLFIYKKLAHGKKPFPWKTAILLLLLVGYLAMIAYVTLWRYGGQSSANLHLFRGYREAWNIYGRRNWQNVLLNVAMFMPLGILLPLVVKYFRNFYWTLAAGFGASMVIELTQLVTKRGAFDVDDLFNNTLGTMLGFCLVMIMIMLIRREKKQFPRIMAYAALPMAVTVCLAGTAIAYSAQELGNLADACTYTVNMNNTDVNLACKLDDSITTMTIYQAETFDIQSCDEYGYAFFDRLGVVPDDVAHYNEEAFFMRHSSPAYSLWVNYLGRTFSYTDFDTETANSAETDRTNLIALLSEFGITIPDAAELTYDGDGRYIFSVSQYIDDSTILNGTITCQYYDDDTLKSIDNNLIAATYYREGTIITQSEAYNRLCTGQFMGNYFEYVSPSEMTITGVSLDYEVDSKGFYQPVYIFTVKLYSANDDVDTCTITIPALAK